MNLKSLLTAVVVMGAGASAYAFPTISTTPEPGGTYINVYYLEEIQLTSADPFSIVSECAMKPYLENMTSGEVINCSSFLDVDFYGSVLHKISFTGINKNGEWMLTVPSGCLKDEDGNFNDEALEFHYVLNDPDLGLGDFPQITLISSDPANGADLFSWGDAIGKITFVTSDDDAVDYIDWKLYDITKGTSEAEKVWIQQGNESRVDVNRRHDDKDYWTDGLYIAVSGSEKLIKGHTYRLELKFCGIGYDPVTNQYPTPQQQAQSLELETYLDFHGLTPPTEYSPYVVEDLSPDPATYDFDNIDMRTFTITYSGPVKPTKFTYSLGQGAGAAPAGEYAPANDADDNGYANVWDFTFDESVLKGITGNIAVTIEAKDADGLPVKGNGDFDQDNFEYNIEWLCNLGADVLVSVDPENGATVKSLSKITVSCEGNKEINLQGTTSEKPSIVAMGRAAFAPIDLDDPVFNDDHTEATWEFDPITISGTYSLIIPKEYFICGDQMLTSVNNQTKFVYTVEGDDPEPGEVVADLLPSAVSIEDNQEITEALTSIVLTFAKVTFMPLDPIVEGSLYRLKDASEEYELVESVTPVENDFFDPTEYTYTFSTPVTLPGTYKFVIPEGAYNDEEYDSSDHQSGRISPELVYNFKMANDSGVSAIVAENGVVTVYDIAGRVVLSNADATQLNTLAEGIYIINGKKYVVK